MVYHSSPDSSVQIQIAEQKRERDMNRSLASLPSFVVSQVKEERRRNEEEFYALVGSKREDVDGKKIKSRDRGDTSKTQINRGAGKHGIVL